MRFSTLSVFAVLAIAASAIPLDPTQVAAVEARGAARCTCLDASEQAQQFGTGPEDRKRGLLEQRCDCDCTPPPPPPTSNADNDKRSLPGQKRTFQGTCRGSTSNVDNDKRSLQVHERKSDFICKGNGLRIVNGICTNASGGSDIED